MAAALPYEENRCCCAKHVQQRELAEAEGHTFSKATADSLDGYQCVEQVCLDAHTHTHHLVNTCGCWQRVADDAHVSTQRGRWQRVADGAHACDTCHAETVPSRTRGVYNIMHHGGGSCAHMHVHASSSLPQTQHARQTWCAWSHVVRVYGHTLPPQLYSTAERGKNVQRYVLEAARVTQAQQQKELRPGTEAGLAAITRELFLTSEVRQGGGFFLGGAGPFIFHKVCQAKVGRCSLADHTCRGGANSTKVARRKWVGPRWPTMVAGGVG